MFNFQSLEVDLRYALLSLSDGATLAPAEEIGRRNEVVIGTVIMPFPGTLFRERRASVIVPIPWESTIKPSAVRAFLNGDIH